jgi:hypothetical protein
MVHLYSYLFLLLQYRLHLSRISKCVNLRFITQTSKRDGKRKIDRRIGIGFGRTEMRSGDRRPDRGHLSAVTLRSTASHANPLLVYSLYQTIIKDSPIDLTFLFNDKHKVRTQKHVARSKNHDASPTDKFATGERVMGEARRPTPCCGALLDRVCECVGRALLLSHLPPLSTSRSRSHVSARLHTPTFGPLSRRQSEHTAHRTVMQVHWPMPGSTRLARVWPLMAPR